MAEKFPNTTELVESAIRDGVFPAASLLVAKGGEVVFKESFGACSDQTVFDVASLTKPVITTTLSMIAVSEGLMSLDDMVDKFIPSATHLGSVAVSNLLNHSSGLPSWQPYYREVPLEAVASVEGRKQVIDAAADERLINKTGSKCEYSDIGFILLGVILEDVFSEPLNSLACELITTPLGMKNSFYRSVKKTPWSGEGFLPAYIGEERDFTGVEFAPTEDCPWRNVMLRGLVHDQNCYAMGGVAGHAGLLSTVDDLHIFVSTLISCMNGKSDFIQTKVVNQFIEAYTSTLAFRHPGTFLLGWDRPLHPNSQSGHRFSPRSIGHLGYTGCSLWVDMEKGFWVILLTNRIHPTSTNQKIKSFRPILHDAILGELG